LETGNCPHRYFFAGRRDFRAPAGRFWRCVEVACFRGLRFA
jgi:hypothetical protein